MKDLIVASVKKAVGLVVVTVKDLAAKLWVEIKGLVELLKSGR